MLVIFTADHKRKASAAFVIIEGEHIDIHLELISV